MKLLFLKKRESLLVGWGAVLGFNVVPRGRRTGGKQLTSANRSGLRGFPLLSRYRRPTTQPRTYLGLCRAAAIFLGLVYTFGARYRMYPDTVSYLDMGDAYLRGDFANALNAYWGALYSWFLGAAVAMFDPSPHGEVLLVHAVNFSIFLCSLVAFEFCLRSVFDSQAILRGTGNLKLARTGLVVLLYALYTWSALELVTVSIPTPDLCVSTVVLLVVGIIARIRAGKSSLGIFGGLGLILGVGYLAKSVMLPLGFVFLATAWISYGRRRGLTSRILISSCGFVAVAALLIVPLSLSHGRFTFGESGRMNYAWHVNRVPHFAHWEGNVAAHGVPLHSTRKLPTNPVVHEFATPISGTYPPWYAPAYWYEGIQPKFNLQQQCVASLQIVRDASVVLFKEQSYVVGMVWGLFVFSLISAKIQTQKGWRAVLNSLRSQWYLFLPAATALGMYSLVHIEIRYLGPFIFLILMGLVWASHRLVQTDVSWGQYAVSAAVVIWALLAVGGVRELAHTTDDSEHCRVAEGLWRMGVERGAPIGHVGNSFKAYWARFGRFKIVAEILPADADSFLAGNLQTKQTIIDKFRSCGVRAIVTKRNAQPGAGWAPIPDTQYFAYLFSAEG
ncbi:hypothetical protein CA54_14410 [Symmachiella macrocystis]|uniref:Glycosyltransferase RgtA/B/C/D-like domain-containing protein n=1 Tax=Symmachiella macrocystis TaxID=2527985 RepID=A0A5C6BLR7_9PLAN|nr:hypothetical protein [Symmachiella macrocystis]TWU12617.1 hypothetical protein CA54_14410 [Symmachiella macrocystis]